MIAHVGCPIQRDGLLPRACIIQFPVSGILCLLKGLGVLSLPLLFNIFTDELSEENAKRQHADDTQQYFPCLSLP